jgi:diadenosine tetraphosphate (Ap4A) HIT family hydrolase
MASVFTQVRTKELPGDILYEDDLVFAILSIAPHSPGHLLVIPVEEYADLIDTPLETRAHLMAVTYGLMEVIRAIYAPPRVAMVAAGLEVDHTHLHVFSLFKNEELDHDAILDMSTEERHTEAVRIIDYLKEHPIS